MGTLVQAHIIVYGMKYIATGENLTFILNEPLFMTIYKHVALPHHFCSLAIIGVQIITPAIRRYRHCDCDNCIRLVTALPGRDGMLKVGGRLSVHEVGVNYYIQWNLP